MSKASFTQRAILSVQTMAAFFSICLIYTHVANLGMLNVPTNPSHTSTMSTMPMDWESIIHPRQTLVVQFISLDRIQQFHARWTNHEQNFMVQMRNMSLMISCPHTDASTILEEVVWSHNWSYVGKLRHDHLFAHGPLLLYKTPAQVDVLFQPIIVSFPRWFMREQSVPKCIAEGQYIESSLTYAMYSGAVFSHHIIHLPILRAFDFYVKVDTDIRFSKPFPFDLGYDMSLRGCAVGHAAVHKSTGCENGNVEALLLATSALNLSPPKSIDYEWCNTGRSYYKSGSIIYGNFQAFSTKLLTHPDVLRISDFMFETYNKGYFHHRWGDQGAFIAYVCFMLDVEDLGNNPQICDYSDLRGSVFSHP